MLISRLSPDKQLIYKLIASQKKYLIAVVFLTILAAVTQLVSFIILYKIFDAMINFQTLATSYLIELSLIMAAGIITGYLLYAIAYYLSHQAAYSILNDLRYRLINKLAYAPLPWLQQHPSGDLRQAIIQDVERIEIFVAHHSVEGLTAIICPLTSSLFLFYFDWRLALATLLIAPIVMLVSKWTMHQMYKDYDKFLKVAAELDSATIEYVRNITVMKVFNMNVKHFEQMRNKLINYYQVVDKITHQVVGGWSIFSSLISANVLFILPIGIVLYIYGYIQLSTIALAVMLGAGILRPLLKVSQIGSQITEIFAGVRRLLPILDLTSPQYNSDLVLANPINLQFTNVSFSYGQRKIVSEINITLAPATVTVLIGRSGCGKSTVAQLMAGLLMPDSGQITIAGVAINQLPDEQRTQLIGLVTQEPFLFQGTILENLCFGKQDISQQQLAMAIKVAQAEAFINQLPNGLQTEINEQGLKLSGGERQRLAIARALLMDTHFLILDEATAFADNITQRNFFEALRTHYPQKALLIIAHNCYGSESVDQIIIMDNGRIQQSGCHQQLLNENDYYRTMWQQQQAIMEWSIVSNPEALK